MVREKVIDSDINNSSKSNGTSNSNSTIVILLAVVIGKITITIVIPENKSSPYKGKAEPTVRGQSALVGQSRP